MEQELIQYLEEIAVKKEEKYGITDYYILDRWNNQILIRKSTSNPYAIDIHRPKRHLYSPKDVMDLQDAFF